jgi:hypothetical protein
MPDVNMLSITMLCPPIDQHFIANKFMPKLPIELRSNIIDPAFFQPKQNICVEIIIVYCSKDGKVDVKDPSSIAKIFIQPGVDTRFNPATNSVPCGNVVGVTVVDRNNNESEVVIVNL